MCDNPAALAGMVLQPGHVITLHIWQHWADLGSYQLDLGFTTVDLGRFLGRQPLQIMAKDTQVRGGGGEEMSGGEGTSRGCEVQRMGGSGWVAQGDIVDSVVMLGGKKGKHGCAA